LTNTLKNSPELIDKLLMLVRGRGMRVATAARQLGLKPRHAQEFFAQEKAWMRDWWEEHYDEVDKYFSGFGYEAPKEDTFINLSAPAVAAPKAEIDVAINTILKYMKPEKEDNSRILLISDLHVPYHHKDSIRFLQHLKDKYNPTRIICLGDEVDHLALSYHEKETEAPSAFDELKMALPVIKQVEQMFPVMDILDSNHGSLAYRKAKTAGIPKHYLKSYADVLQVGDGWKWHFDMVVDLPTGQKCYLHHGKSANITKTSQAMSMCSVAGHYHNTFKIEYWANPIGLYWGMQAGCLIDDRSFAFNYNNVNLHRPLIGTGLIIDGLPILEPMVLDLNGRWVGK